VTEALDQHLVGWAYWEFKNYADLTTSAGTGSEGFYNDDGTLQKAKVKALARSYFAATQGVPTSITFDAMFGDFVGYYTVDTTITEPTILFYSGENFYPSGYILTVTDSTGAALMKVKDMDVVDSKTNYIEFLVKNEKYNGQSLKVVLRGKQCEEELI